MDIFFTKPDAHPEGRESHYMKAFSAVDEVITNNAEFRIEFTNDPGLIQVEVVIDIPDKFYNPDNKKCRTKFTLDELTPEHVAKVLFRGAATSLFLNDEWYSRASKRAREDALQEALTRNNWGIRDDDFRSN